MDGVCGARRDKRPRGRRFGGRGRGGVRVQVQVQGEGVGVAHDI